jgi:hypothetical protein
MWPLILVLLSTVDELDAPGLIFLAALISILFVLIHPQLANYYFHCFMAWLWSLEVWLEIKLHLMPARDFIRLARVAVENAEIERSSADPSVAQDSTSLQSHKVLPM